ncbi:MAG: glycosyltransferase, partial [Acidobacteriota bacterium]
IPLAEALACGTPILTSTHDGPRELVGDAARCVDPENPAAVADALVELLADPDALAELSRRGLERSRHVSWPRAAATIRTLLHEVTARDG